MLTRQAKIVFGLVCKNVASRMDPTMAAVEETGKRFADYAVIVMENNSDDDTGKKVMAWQQRNPKVCKKACCWVDCMLSEM